MIVLESKIEQVAESVPHSRHEGKTHPCAVLLVNMLEREALQTWSEKQPFLKGCQERSSFLGMN